MEWELLVRVGAPVLPRPHVLLLGHEDELELSGGACYRNLRGEATTI
jgi:hypothetical protein